MSSHKRDWKEKEKQIEKFSLDEKLRTLNSKDLYDMVQNLMEKNPEVRRLALEWIKGRIAEEKETFINDELLMEYWEKARDIMSEFHEYGGGPRDEEYKAYEWLEKISELIEEGNISTKAKLEFLDEAFEEYDLDSPFEDELTDIFFDLCQTKKEWKYLVGKLEDRSSSWRKELVMEIQRNYLQDDEAYLKERMGKLHYGSDYWDLVDFYVEKGDAQKALETAEQGILKGEGSLKDLFQFLFNHFAQKRDTANLERITQTAITRKTEEKFMLDKLFEYYKTQNDYEKAKETLTKALEYVQYGDYYEEYRRMKEFLKASDWKQIEPKILKEAQEKNIYNYLKICLDKNMKETVLQTILNPPKNRWYAINFDEFAEKLKEDFPEKIIEYYWQKARSNIPGGNRKTYQVAAKYLAKAKHVYTELLKDETRWKQLFSELKTEFKNRPAFLQEVEKL